MALMEELTSLLQSYGQAFDDKNAVAIATKYTMPCAISDADGALVFSQSAALIEKFDKNCQRLTELKHQYSEFVISEMRQLGRNVAKVDVGWRVYFSDKPSEFRCLYIMHKTELGWKIFSAQLYVEAHSKE
jgi:ketosteroid isomerase-like protein